MESKESLFSHLAPILPVENVIETIHYYERELGFEVTFQWDDPVRYAVVARGASVRIHFCKKQDDFQPSAFHDAVRIFVFDVDKVYEEYRKKKVEILAPPENREYGQREFDIKDINGYILSFGMSIEMKKQNK